ncbi:MAG TPA: DNA-binding response regulator [Bacteroidales bacterium]|nr:DNA-binding response regulator [Bacteroidales bacterium]
MTTLFIVDDHKIFRESLAELMTKQGFKVIGMAGNGKQLLELLDKSIPDLVIMDIAMPEMDGCEAAKIAMEKYPNLKILTLSSFGDEKYYYLMINAGVKGFVLKNAGINEVKQAATEILEGGSWFSAELMKSVINSMNKKTTTDASVKLSERELEVLKLICKGLTAEKIAEELNLSHETIRTYRANLLSKTGCSNAPALVLYAIKNRIIELG